MTTTTLNWPLIRAVTEQIENNPETWKQSVWRCGTGMCFAGWATEISGDEWMVDSNDRELIGLVGELVLVDPSLTTSQDISDDIQESYRDYSAPLQKLLDSDRLRGKAVVTTPERARELLGLNAVLSDDTGRWSYGARSAAEMLFGGGNSLPTIKAYIFQLALSDPALWDEAHEEYTAREIASIDIETGVMA